MIAYSCFIIYTMQSWSFFFFPVDKKASFEQKPTPYQVQGVHIPAVPVLRWRCDSWT